MNFSLNHKNELVKKIKSFIQSAIHLCIIVMFFQVTELYAESTSANNLLEISPKQCVAVRQGQDCYVDIKIAWQTNAVGNYCLYSTEQTKPLKCWHQVTTILFKKELVSNKNVTFSLKKQDSTEVLATAQLAMAWVYKKNSRSHSSWRMF